MLNHTRHGSGEPLVLVHGLGSQWQVWQPVLERLAPHREVIAPDLPGFGASTPLPGEPTVEALADAVAGFLEELGLERPHVAGNSLGGGIALELARTGRARSATALSPIGFARGRERTYASTSLLVAYRAVRGLGGLVPSLMASAAGRTAMLSQLIAKPWRLSPDEATGAMRNLAASPSFEAARPHVTGYTWPGGDVDVPVTIAWGERDWLLVPRQGRRARRLMPGANHVWLKGCGHVPTWDDPEQVASVLLAGSQA
jgi:pimeloyl-ACP methyl ester carboxylesterase